jgi:hypothetical protein
MNPRKSTCQRNREAFQDVELMMVDKRGNVVAVQRHGKLRWPRLRHGDSGLPKLRLPRMRTSR